jgi:glycosyltransferase involved in cell wall biosynthesis
MGSSSQAKIKSLRIRFVSDGMKIWIVKSGEALPIDGPSPRIMRAGMLAEALIAAGHEVTWWASTFDHFKKVQRMPADVSKRLSEKYLIKLIWSIGYRKNIGLSRLVSHAHLAYRFCRAISREAKPDLIFAAMPTIESAVASARYARANRIPLVIDIRDLWPDLFVNGVPSGLRTIAQLGLVPYNLLLRYALCSATAIFGISPAYLKWALLKARRSENSLDRIFSLGYMPGKVPFRQIPQTKICWFLGSFGHTYDLDTIIEAAAELARAGRRDIRFVLSGAGERFDPIKSRIQNLHLENVELTGWLSRDQIAEMMERSYLGLACYSTIATQGIPNKIIEYLSAGLPVISSLKGEASDLILKHQCGVNYDPGNKQSLMAAITSVCDDVTQWRCFQVNGLALFNELFNAKKIYPSMVGDLENIQRSFPN